MNIIINSLPRHLRTDILNGGLMDSDARFLLEDEIEGMKSMSLWNREISLKEEKFS